MSKRLLMYCSFAIACIVVIATFITATAFTQLAIAILLYPVLAFCAYKVLPIKQRHAIATSQAVTFPLSKPKQEARNTTINNKTENVGISDIDKRVFLKLIGGTSIFLFLFSIFNKKTEGLFFKSLPDPVLGKISLEDTAGNKINPAQKKPLDDYSISDIENGAITFYGFISKDRSWYIMRVDISTGTFRYIKDQSNYPVNWSNRTNLKYDYFDNVFLNT